MEETNTTIAQASDPAGQQPQSPSSPMQANQGKAPLPLLPIAAAVAVIVIALGAYLAFFSHSPPAQTTSTVQTSTAPQTTLATSSTTTAASTQPYLSRAQASSYIGSGGNYSATALNQSTLSFYPANLSITGGYGVLYLNNSTGSISEVVLMTGNLTGTYDSLLSEYSTQYFNKTFFQNGANYGSTIQIGMNNTTGGMTYSYSYSHDNGSVTPYVLAIIGKKNDAVSFLVIDSSKSLPSESKVASDIAGELP